MWRMTIRRLAEKETYIFLFLFFCALRAGAQVVSISGKVHDKRSIPIAGVNVHLSAEGASKALYNTETNNAGRFELQNILPGVYRLSFTSIGYKPLSYGPFTVKSEDIILPGHSLEMLFDSTRLNKVTVLLKRKALDIKPGITTLNLDRELFTGSVLDVLAKVPGVQIAENGNITLKGKQGVVVYIDGKPGANSIENMAELLRGMQSSSVSQIEVMTVPPSKYDAAGNAGVINIRLKKETGYGTNGSINTGFGYGNFHKANAGFTLNTSGKKLNVYTNYNYGDNKRIQNISLYRNIQQQNQLATLDANANNTQSRLGHTFKAGADYRVSDHLSVGASAMGTYTTFSAIKRNSTLLQNNFRTDSTVLTLAKQNRQLNGTNFSGYFSLMLDTAGSTLTAENSYYLYNRGASEFQNNTFQSSTGTSYRLPAVYQIGSPSGIYIYSATADLLKNMPKGSIEAGLKYVHSGINNRFDFFSRNAQGGFLRDRTLSNVFRYNEGIYAAYFTYHFSLGKTSFDAGLRGEYTRSKGASENQAGVTDRRYFNLFPNLTIKYNIKDDQQQLVFSFNQRINRPSYADLNPFVNFLDPYTYYKGNPFLKPEYGRNFELSYLFKDYSLTARYSYTKGMIYNLNQQNDITRVLISGFVNLGNSYQYGFELNAPIKISEIYNIDANLEMFYIHFTGDKLNTGSPNLATRISQNFNLGKNLTAELVANYETPSVYGINRFRSVYYGDIAIGKTFLKNQRLTAKLSLSDIFNTNRDRFYTTFQNLDLRSTEKAETRIGRISLNYRFGKGKASARSETSSNESERERTA